MKPVEVFAVVVHTVGMIVSLAGAAILFWALLNLVLGGPASPIGLTIIGVPTMLVGLWLLRGSPGLLAYAFPKEDRRERNN